MKSADYNTAKEIMGENFIGVDELKNTNIIMLDIPKQVPTILYSTEDLTRCRNEYMLILGLKKLKDGRDVSINNLIDIYGKNPSISEPCFYNQDWYEKEDFINKPLEEKWFLIRKNVYEKSRAVQPNELMQDYIFPTAVRCVYAFFVTWETKNNKLWYHDFVWCSDTDHNGDRVYVGKYNDVDGINKNGFSIHRHLGLRDCYGCID